MLGVLINRTDVRFPYFFVCTTTVSQPCIAGKQFEVLI